MFSPLSDKVDQLIGSVCHYLNLHHPKIKITSTNFIGLVSSQRFTQIEIDCRGDAFFANSTLVLRFGEIKTTLPTKEDVQKMFMERIDMFWKMFCMYHKTNFSDKSLKHMDFKCFLFYRHQSGVTGDPSDQGYLTTYQDKSDSLTYNLNVRYLRVNENE